MKKNLKLWVAIKERGMTQASFAKLCGDHFTLISRIINGWVNVDEKRKSKYSELLGKSVQELFEK